MLRQIKSALLMVLVMTMLTGIMYPLVVTGVAQLIFPRQANGSLIRKNETVIGSHLIGQSFAAARYFHGRPSAAGDQGYDASASGGSNLGPTSAKLRDRTIDAAEALKKENAAAQVPVELVTTSASGLDPDISPAAASFQIPRIAKARQMTESDLRKLIESQLQERQLKVLGEPRINVLELNLALDAASPEDTKEVHGSKP